MGLLGGLIGESSEEKFAGRMEDRYNRIKNEGVTDTPSFQQGQAALRNLLKRRRKSDEARVARMGAQGSEFSIAQSASRGRERAKGMTNLIGEAGRAHADRKSRALSRLIQARRQASRRKAQTLGAITQGVTSLGKSAFKFFDDDDEDE